MKEGYSVTKLLPVLFGFFIMGFVDVVGISTNYVKQDFALSDSLANLIPMMVFIWFAVLSVPTGLMMNKLGRRKTVVISMGITLIAMLVPLVSYQFTVVLIAFALLGIGNTILQVSLNPLMTNVVSGERLTSSLTLGQFIKAIASFLGPVIAGFASGSLGNWKFIFPVFAAVTLLSGSWLAIVKINENHIVSETSSFRACFGLLRERVIILLFLGIIFVVGVDVGMNTTVPRFIMERSGIPLEKAGLGTSLYFAARTIGTFAGAILLVKLSGRKFYIVSMITAISALLVMLFISNLWFILVLIFAIGLAVANVFSIIFSAALRKMPYRGNEISGLMIMGVAGGGVILPVMGIVSDTFGQTGAMVVIMLAMVYLLYNALKLEKS